MQIETYTLPAHWASALINDDTSGMDYRDEKPFHDFCRFMMNEHGNNWPLDCSEETQFMTYHDARRFGVLACDVLDFTFDVTPRGMTQMINMTTAQRVTLERKWSELDETTRPPLDRFLDSVKPTVACDDAVAVQWAGMWLCIERSGHAHS